MAAHFWYFGLQKKGTGTAFCAGPLAQKKKAGVEQEKAGHARFVNNAYSLSPFRLPTHLRTKHYNWNIPGPVRVFFTSGRLFLTRVGHVRVWVPFSAGVPVHEA